MIVVGALGGALAASGLLLVVLGWHAVRRPSLMSRVAPYVRDVRPDLAPVARSSTWTAVFGPGVMKAAAFVGDLAGSATSVRRRLLRLGRDGDVEAFRVQQLLWGGFGFAGAALLSVLLWSAGRGSALGLLIFCALGFVGGVLGRDNRLSAQVREHERRLLEEFPAVADLLALSVAAGESPVAGLERVSAVAHGVLADELGRVLAEIRTGTVVPQAFDALASRTGVPAIARFAEGLAVAVDRGTPLVDVLHAQAADVREAARRDLIEAGGRREIAMMLPVVFLIMPITIVFAFFPGYIGLRLTT